jgi:hypothetical protein
MLRASVFMCLVMTTKTADRSLRMTEMGKHGRKQTSPAVGKEGTAVGQTPARICYTWCD